MLNKAQIKFITIVPGCDPSYILAGTFKGKTDSLPGNCRNRGMAHSNPMTFMISIQENGAAICLSKKRSFTTPPFAVTLKDPSFGLMSASIVGKKIYGASTVS